MLQSDPLAGSVRQLIRGTSMQACVPGAAPLRLAEQPEVDACPATDETELDPDLLQLEVALVAFEDGVRLGDVVPDSAVGHVVDALRDWHRGRPLSVLSCACLERLSEAPHGRTLHNWTASGHHRDVVTRQTRSALKRFHETAREQFGDQLAAVLLFRRSAMCAEVALAERWIIDVFRTHREALEPFFAHFR